MRTMILTHSLPDPTQILDTVGQRFKCAICGVSVDTADIWHGTSDPSTWHRPVRP